jgi:WD40 repeat protein
VETGRQLALLSGHQSTVSSACFSPDGQTVLTASHDHSARTWDAQSWQLIGEFKSHTDIVNTACFSPDGKKIVTASNDRTAIIWQTASFTPLAILKGHEAVVSTACFSPDGSRIVTASWDGTVKTWDGQSGSLKGEFKGHQYPVVCAGFSTDGLRVVSACRDNTAKIWDVDKGKVLSTFFAVDSTDYFMQTPATFYMCTPGAAKLLHYVDKDQKVISFDQLDVTYNRPDLVLETMGSQDTLLTSSYKKAWQKRITKLGFDTSLFTKGLHVPEADFENREQVGYEQSNGRLSLHIKAKDDSLVLDRYNVWINEVPLFGVRGISLRSRKTNSLDTTLTVILSGGKNRVEASVTNVGGMESYRVPLDVNFTPAAPDKGKLHFIGIGIDHFKDSQYNLRWSVKDIRDLASKFQGYYGETCRIDTVFDQDVTIERIKALKASLDKTNENDKVIVAYSGHGLLSKDYDYFLSTYDVNFADPRKGGLPYEALEELLDSIPARKKLLLLDACHSGEVDKEEVSKMVRVQAELDSNQKGMIVLHDTANKKFGTKNSFELMQEIFVNVARSTGATIISAAAGTQFALESGNLKNGVFSYSILELMEQSKTATVIPTAGLRQQKSTSPYPWIAGAHLEKRKQGAGLAGLVTGSNAARPCFRRRTLSCVPRLLLCKFHTDAKNTHI